MEREESGMTVEVRCPVDRLLFFRCTAACSGLLECYCRRCKRKYTVELPKGSVRNDTTE